MQHYMYQSLILMLNPPGSLNRLAWGTMHTAFRGKVGVRGRLQCWLDVAGRRYRTKVTERFADGLDPTLVCLAITGASLLTLDLICHLYLFSSSYPSFAAAR